MKKGGLTMAKAKKKLSEYSDQAIRLLAARNPKGKYAEEARRRRLKFKVKGKQFAVGNIDDFSEGFDLDLTELGAELGAEFGTEEEVEDILSRVTEENREELKKEVLTKLQTGELTVEEAMALMDILAKPAGRQPLVTFGFIKGDRSYIFRNISVGGVVKTIGGKKSYEAADSKKLNDIFKQVFGEKANRGKSLPSLILGLIHKAREEGWVMIISRDPLEVETLIKKTKGR